MNQPDNPKRNRPIEHRRQLRALRQQIEVGQRHRPVREAERVAVAPHVIRIDAVQPVAGLDQLRRRPRGTLEQRPQQRPGTGPGQGREG